MKLMRFDRDVEYLRIDLKTELKREVKAMAAMKGISVRTLVEDALIEYLEAEKESWKEKK